jgi:hypothetical protein
MKISQKQIEVLNRFSWLSLSTSVGFFFFFFSLIEEERGYKGGSFPFLILMEERMGDPKGMLPVGY